MSVDAHPLIDKRLQIGHFMPTTIAPYVFLMVIGVGGLIIDSKPLPERIGMASMALIPTSVLCLIFAAMAAFESDGFAEHWLVAFAIGMALGISGLKYARRMESRKGI